MSNFNKIKLNDCFDEVQGLIGTEFERGLYVGFEQLHNYYSIVDGSSTDITGSPTSGKSEFLLEMLINTAEFYGVKHVLNVPDMGTPDEVFKEIISKKTKKSFNEYYYKDGNYFKNNNFITEAELLHCREWVNEHFLILDYPKRPTPIQWYEDFKRLRFDEKYYTGSVDSWKDLKIDYNMRADLFLDEVLTYRNKMMQNIGGHMFQIVHPLKTEKNSDGSFRMATSYDIKGCTSWYDNGKAILSLCIVDLLVGKVDIGILKAKPKKVGRKEIHENMYYDISKGRYFENQNDYALPEKDKTILKAVNNNEAVELY